MASQQMPMSVRKYLRDQLVRQKDDHSARFVFSFNSSPQDVVLDETVICEMFDQLLTLRIVRQFSIENEFLQGLA